MLTPRPYQLGGRDFLAGRRHALLADEMRVGKTPQAILAAHKVGARTVLVVCPAIAVPHWRREFVRWWPDDEPPAACVVSYDRLRLDWDEIKERRFDVVIADECHFARNPEARRTKLIYGKGGVGWIADRMWVLSGTPAPKHAGELWCMLRAFNAVGMTYDEFLRYYCIVDKLGVVRGTKEKHIPELREILAKVMLRRTRKQVAPDLPDVDYQFLNIDVVGDADLPLEPGQINADWLESHASDLSEARQAVAWSKVQPLVDNIAFALANDLIQQCVVFGWHVEPINEVAARLQARGIPTGVITGATTPKAREQIQRQLASRLTKVVCGNILACGTAITLSAASHGYFLELDWVSANNVQAANRLVSMDKKEPVTIDVATVPGSIDDRVQATLLRRVRELSQLY